MNYGKTRTTSQASASQQGVLEASYCDLILSEVAEQRGALALGAGSELLKGASRLAGRVNRGVLGFGKRSVGAINSLRGDSHFMGQMFKQGSPRTRQTIEPTMTRMKRRALQYNLHTKLAARRGTSRLGAGLGAATLAAHAISSKKHKHESELSFSEQLELGLSDLGRSAAGALHSAMPKVKSFFHRAMNAGRGAMNSMRSKVSSAMGGGRAPKIAGHLTGPASSIQKIQSKRPIGGGGMRPRLGHAAAFGAGAVAGGMTMRKPSQADPYNQRSRTQ